LKVASPIANVLKKTFFKIGHPRGKKDFNVMQCSGKVGFGAESSLYTCDEGPKKLEDRGIKTGCVRTISLRYRLRVAKWFVWRYMTLKKKL
jgi:hypothetical protein